MSSLNTSILQEKTAVGTLTDTLPPTPSPTPDIVTYYEDTGQDYGT